MSDSKYYQAQEENNLEEINDYDNQCLESLEKQFICQKNADPTNKENIVANSNMGEVTGMTKALGK